MKVFWLDGQLVVKAEGDEERKALEVLFPLAHRQNEFMSQEEDGFSIGLDADISAPVNRV